MAIIKRGDAQPIVDVYDSEGEAQKCSSCGSKLVVIAIEDQDNRLICECCDDDSATD